MFTVKICIALLPLLALARANAIGQQPQLEHLLSEHYEELAKAIKADEKGTEPRLVERIMQKIKDDLAMEMSARIIEGYDVKGVDNAPYLVSLSLTPLIYSHQCAGAIIGKRWVLTAGHCVEELRRFNGDVIGIPIYAGLSNRSNVSDAQVRLVDFGATHRQFNGVAGSDNIALLHVSQSFVYSNRVQQIALPDLDEDYSNKTAALYGWGLTTADGDEYSKKLQYAFAPLLNSEQCAKQLPSDAPLSRKQVCAQVKACYGDGGSPLVYWPITGPAELVGLGSWSYMPCGYADRPTVYTSVPAYVDWIYQVISAYYQLN
ncbi:lectizyme [Drosophila mojavensis]|uniref:Peptidase S1 domain-containing protein n=1 Tax=Drosophila mojavensis TaxID=7230 RepID=A0A0Q9XFK4_DROMO|nr:lectizyme [Drosophila mojavensis]KRG03422.1 uncharacterized protein Dmoj_GI26178 [Drosophila mojavensis]